MIERRPYSLVAIDALLGKGHLKSHPSKSSGLEMLKHHYKQDFGYDPKSWLEYALENDTQFVEDLNDLYGVESSIEEYKTILLDYEKRSDIFHVKYYLQHFTQYLENEIPKTPSNAFRDLIFETKLDIDLIRQSFITQLGFDEDGAIEIEQQALIQICNKYIKLRENRGLDSETLFKQVYKDIYRRQELATRIVMSIFKLEKSGGKTMHYHLGLPGSLNSIVSLISTSRIMPKEKALELLKNRYQKDFGYNAQAWLDYALENDSEFVRLLNDTYQVEPGIEEYKQILLDHDNISGILYVYLVVHQYKESVKLGNSKTLVQTLKDLLGEHTVSMEAIRKYLPKYLGMSDDEFSEIEQRVLTDFYQKYREVKDERSLDGEELFQLVYEDLLLRLDLATDILINVCDLSKSEANNIAQSVLDKNNYK